MVHVTGVVAQAWRHKFTRNMDICMDTSIIKRIGMRVLRRM